MTVDIGPNGRYLTIDGRRFHAFWLRDNAPGPLTRSPSNGQKLIELNDIPAAIRIVGAEENDDQVLVQFDSDCIKNNDNQNDNNNQNNNQPHQFSKRWLLSNAYDVAKPAGRGWLCEHHEAWEGGHAAALTTARFDDVASDEARLKDWLYGLRRFGVATLTDGPVREGALFDVVDLFGYVRETNYGRLFEVRTQVNPTNLAFTGLGLQSHADNPYRDPVPTIQVLYCLESSASGGDNMVVDGFKAALRLRDEDPEGFTALTSYCARWEFSGDAVSCLQSKRPMIELLPDGEISSVRFNNRSAAAIQDVPFDAMETYYRGYRRFAKIIDDPAMEVCFRLDPGDCFVVDNTRVLHARKGYSGAGTRWLQGCYADKDGLNSRLAVLEARQG